MQCCQCCQCLVLDWIHVQGHRVKVRYFDSLIKFTMRRRNSDGGSARSNGTLPASGRRLTRAATAAAAAAAAATSAGKISTTYSGRTKPLKEYTPVPVGCGSLVDPLGRHGLSCKFAKGRHSRHANSNDLIKIALSTADVPAVLEPLGLSNTGNERPNGLSLFPWKEGKTHYFAKRNLTKYFFCDS